MNKYTATCTCGDKMETMGNNVDEAFDNLMKTMTPEAMAAHWTTKHSGQPMPDMEAMKAGLKGSIKLAV